MTQAEEQPVGTQERPRVVDTADATPDRERDEDLFGDGGRHRDGRVPILVGGRDVEEHQLISAGIAVPTSQFDRITSVAQAHEVDAFDDPTPGDIKTRNKT